MNEQQYETVRALVQAAAKRGVKVVSGRWSIDPHPSGGWRYRLGYERSPDDGPTQCAGWRDSAGRRAFKALRDHEVERQQQRNRSVPGSPWSDEVVERKRAERAAFDAHAEAEAWARAEFDRRRRSKAPREPLIVSVPTALNLVLDQVRAERNEGRE